MRNWYLYLLAVILACLMAVLVVAWFGFLGLESRVISVENNVASLDAQVQSLRQTYADNETLSDVSCTHGYDWVQEYFKSGRPRNPFRKEVRR